MILLLFVVPKIAPQADLVGRFVTPPFDWMIERINQIVALVGGA